MQAPFTIPVSSDSDEDSEQEPPSQRQRVAALSPASAPRTQAATVPTTVPSSAVEPVLALLRQILSPEVLQQLARTTPVDNSAPTARAAPNSASTGSGSSAGLSIEAVQQLRKALKTPALTTPFLRLLDRVGAEFVLVEEVLLPMPSDPQQQLTALLDAPKSAMQQRAFEQLLSHGAVVRVARQEQAMLRAVATAVRGVLHAYNIPLHTLEPEVLARVLRLLASALSP